MIIFWSAVLTKKQHNMYYQKELLLFHGRLLLMLVQWWFVNPDMFVPAGNFRINEFSGLLNRPSPDISELLINILNCSQLIASFRGIYVAPKRAVFLLLFSMFWPLKRTFYCFFSVCFWPLKRPLYCFFSICLWPWKLPFGIPTIMPLLLNLKKSVIVVCLLWVVDRFCSTSAIA